MSNVLKAEAFSIEGINSRRIWHGLDGGFASVF